MQAMENSIANLRSAAKKTFNFSKPNSDFRKENDDSIGIFLTVFSSSEFFTLEISNYRKTAPMEVTFNMVNKFKKIKHLTWTEVISNVL